MARELLLADVLEECCRENSTGALFISVPEANENLIRFYLKDSEICYLSYGEIKDRDCLTAVECQDLGKAVYFEGIKAPVVSSTLPKTDEIIASLRQSGKRVLVD